ncbi:hypothetical protein CBM2615_B200012 [Cupriavidus taiwanensis]|uniref:Uncharacterized protein n=1 Tax=Cupriavidus taiwanensis TaxID=164546 RepID=A0A375E8K0_9BURK|nr:hypothetical protein CBM2614_B210012 [Cupriavidus taiwanensis]SOZ68445.1 hypothetical protein CBM2615_B200012 [Cupriavidus taiwanensis]SOZ71537.1 hypothetical protein CBM2613_B180012 [Cupriavidus taiwanensis]SPA09327.1 hypothetical protein CBM2625_B180012 [Cupriavidus taiwanensis]
MGRLQGERHRPRAGPHRPGRVHRAQAQLYQPRPQGDGLVRRLSAADFAIACAAAPPPWAATHGVTQTRRLHHAGNP